MFETRTGPQVAPGKPESLDFLRNAPTWSVQVYAAPVLTGWYANLFQPSGRVLTWRNCLSRRGAVLSLADYAREHLTGDDQAAALSAVRLQIEAIEAEKGKGCDA